MTNEQLNDALAVERVNHPHRALRDERWNDPRHAAYVGQHRDAIMDRTPMVETSTTDETTSGWLDR